MIRLNIPRFIQVFSVLILLACIAAISSCATPPEENARSLLDRLEFEEGEEGCVNITGNIDLNTSIFFRSNATLILKKTKGDNAPEC